MDVSSTGSGSASIQVDVMKKATQVQEQQILKVLDSANQQSQEMTAQKTGVGGHLNITG